MLKAWISVGVCICLRAQVMSDLTKGLQATRGKQKELFRTLFLKSVSCTFLTFIFANCFSFKHAHPNSHLSSFHTSTSTFPALPEKQTIFPVLLLGNVREQLLGPGPEFILPHVATSISNKRQHSCKKEKLVETKKQIMRFKADRETRERIVEPHIQKLQELTGLRRWHHPHDSLICPPFKGELQISRVHCFLWFVLDFFLRV